MQILLKRRNGALRFADNSGGLVIRRNCSDTNPHVLRITGNEHHVRRIKTLFFDLRNRGPVTASPQHKLHWLAEQTLNWSGLPVVHVRPTVLLDGFFLIFTSDSVKESNQIRLPLGEGKTSPSAVYDVARVIAQILIDPQPHIGKTYHLTGPHSENMHFRAEEYSKALGRTITHQDIPVEPWCNELLERGLPVHLVNHLATMANLHRTGRYDRMSDDVRTLTGREPLSVQDFIRRNTEKFTASVS